LLANPLTTKNEWEDFYNIVIDVSEVVVDLLGYDYLIHLNYVENNELKKLIVSSDFEIKYTHTDIPTVDDLNKEQFNYDGRLRVTSEEVFTAINKNSDFDELRNSTWGDGFTVASAEHKQDSIRFVSLYEPNKTYLSVVAFIVPEDSTKNEQENISDGSDMIKDYWVSATELINDEIIDKMLNEEAVQSYVFDMGNFTRDGYRVFMFKFEDTDHDRANLPVTLEEIFGADFFANEERIEDYIKLNRAGDYHGLNDLVDTYLTQSPEVNEVDSAHTILELLDPILEVMDQVNIVYDRFDDDATIYYKGVTEINALHHFVPYTTTRNNTMHAKIGFQNEDWLFFNRIEISLGGNEKITWLNLKENEVLREVINDGLIHEEVTRVLNEMHFNQFLNASENPILKFTGANNRSLDYEFTEAERNAIEVLNVFRDTNAFPNLLFNWNR